MEMNTLNNEKEFELVNDFYNYVLTKMDFELGVLPNANEVDMINTVNLGDAEYKSLIRYMAFEEIANYMEKRCHALE